MEYGVRGIRVFAGKPTLESGYWEDGTELARTNIAAFQQLWFDLAAAQLGFTGSVKWDAYWGKYNSTYNSLYAMIGPAVRGVAALPWLSRAQPAPPDDRQRLAGPAGGSLGGGRLEARQFRTTGEGNRRLRRSAGQLTLLGLDTHGRDLNTVSPEISREYSIGGLPAHTSFNLALWNATGNGESTSAGTVRSDAAGVARFEVPLHAAFSLTTVPVF